MKIFVCVKMGTSLGSVYMCAHLLICGTFTSGRFGWEVMSKLFAFIVFLRCHNYSKKCGVDNGVSGWVGGWVYLFVCVCVKYECMHVCICTCVRVDVWYLL